MPIVIDGFVVADSRTLTTHAGHALTVPDPADGLGVRLWCDPCGTELAREYKSTSLPCGCADKADHAEGVRLQERFRKQYRIPKSTCVGCYLGDDGPSLHSCVVHPV